ncbi:MAG: hypothetical protein QOE90_3327 [Thermoplasmata archaeon]|jgi:hypothetical protein|nr:hypothetical protein [Thermoplasmata archaeon]
MTTNPLDAPIQNSPVLQLAEKDDALYRALRDTMSTQPDPNLLLSNLNPGESEEVASMLAFYHGTGSEHLVRWGNAYLLARRAERGNFFKQFIATIKSIGRADHAPKPGLFGLRRT